MQTAVLGTYFILRNKPWCLSELIMFHMHFHVHLYWRDVQFATIKKLCSRSLVRIVQF